MKVNALLIHDEETIAVKAVTTYTTVSPYDPPPQLPSPSGRWSAVCDDSRSETSSTEIATPKDYKVSPSFKYYKSEPMPALTNGAVTRSLEDNIPISPRSPRYHHKSHLSETTDYVTSSHRNSYDGKAHSPNAYAISQMHGHRYEPYSYPRQRAYSTPMRYSPYAPSHYYPPEEANGPPSPPIVRTQPVPYSVAPFSSPPTPHDRRRAHILSEQKRRESINGGFVELKQRLTSPPITRALSSGSHQSSETEPESKLLQESNDILGGGSRESKAATLRKAVKALDVLADKVLDLQLEVAMLRRESHETQREKKVGDEGL